MTDKVIENIKAKLGSGDELDGFEELRYTPTLTIPSVFLRMKKIMMSSEEDQKVIREAIERGSSKTSHGSL
jgi:hypothetical protein